MTQGVTNRDGETGSLLITPKAFLDALSEKLSKILELIELSLPRKDHVGDYITEPEAEKILGRKTTWFWRLRTRGILAYAKVGNKVFYSRKDIENLLEASKIKSIKTKTC